MEYKSTQGLTDNGTSGEITIRDGVAVNSRSARSSEVTSADAFAREGLMGTAQSSSGGHVVNREIRLSDTVKVAGQRCTIGLAVSMGLIRKDAVTGDYVEVSTPSANPKDDPQAQQAGAGVGLASGGTAEEALGGAFQADDDTEGALAQLLQRTTGGGAVVALESVIKNGDLDMLALDHLASEAGMEPAEMETLVNTARDGMENAVYQRLEQSFPIHDRNLFSEFVHGSAQNKALFQASVRDLMNANSVVGFEKLAQGFTESLDVIDPDAVAEALKAEGIPHTRTAKGFLLGINGQQMSFRDAVRQGLIAPQRA